MIARSDRPTSREISWVRPPIRPRTDSRSERVLVDAGSIAYSAVTQPSPLPLRHRGTPSDADAAHSTRVRPNSTRTDPAAWSSQCRVNVTGRSSSSARPSARAGLSGMTATLLTGTGPLVRAVAEQFPPFSPGQVPARRLTREVGGRPGVGVPTVGGTSEPGSDEDSLVSCEEARPDEPGRRHHAGGPDPCRALAEGSRGVRGRGQD